MMNCTTSKSIAVEFNTLIRISLEPWAKLGDTSKTSKGLVIFTVNLALLP